MAKRKTPKVEDLRPQEITTEELNKLQDFVSNMNKYQIEVGRLETQKHAALHIISQFQNSIQELQKELEDKYGKVDIDIKTGKIQYNDGEANKKN